MVIDAPTFTLSSDFFGIGYSTEGVGATLSVKNKGEDTLSVIKGWLVSDSIDGINDWRNLPFYIPSTNQGYNYTHYSQYSSYNIPNIPNFGGNGISPQNYNNSHRFVKSFDLKGFNSYGHLMSFDLMFFPYYTGVYSADIYIEFNENQGEQNQIYHLNITGKALGYISEIDKTLTPEMVITVDKTNNSNLEFYFE